MATVEMLDTNGMRIPEHQRQWYIDMKFILDSMVVAVPIAFQTVEMLQYVSTVVERIVPLCQVKIVEGQLAVQKLNPPDCDY